MKKVPLGPSKYALVDDSDFDRVSHLRWHVGQYGYAVHSVWRGKRIRMHRFIMEAPDNKFVDHINGDRLDNRRSNLRLATNSENLRNQKIRSNNTSGFKGVTWSITNKKWRVMIGTPPNRVHIGYYDKLLDAAYCYNKAAIFYYGEFARLNEV